ATRPGNSASANSTTRCAGQVSTSAGSCRLATEKHLLQRVAAQAATESLERDHLVGRDVAEVDRRPEALDEPRLSGLPRRLEEDVLDAEGVGDLADQLRAHAPRRVEDAGGAAFPRLGDHLPRAGLQLVAEPLRPLVDRVLDAGVLRADLGEDGELAGEVGD